MAGYLVKMDSESDQLPEEFYLEVKQEPVVESQESAPSSAREAIDLYSDAWLKVQSTVTLIADIKKHIKHMSRRLSDTKRVLDLAIARQNDLRKQIMEIDYDDAALKILKDSWVLTVPLKMLSEKERLNSFKISTFSQCVELAANGFFCIGGSLAKCAFCGIIIAPDTPAPIGLHGSNMLICPFIKGQCVGNIKL